ncbi:MAG TPA: DUF924 family protein [Burkholderiaceae bacterium]
MTDTPTASEANAVLDFWFGPPGSSEHGTFRDLWFTKSDATDREIARRFGALIERALRGELTGWETQPDSALAQILLLDQFTRNVFRETPRAFAGDARALAAASAMVGRRQDETLPPIWRSFAYMPFEHAESTIAQDEAVRLFTRLAAVAPDLGHMLDYAQRHREVIQRFGRFPHRNAILGRHDTPEEIAFLQQPGSRF